ncbi:hypothetical protein [Fictibacillus barbaricus]|uniref:Uncharacterized protein n=1 Tax=Fictibacillus barbaricus TaxID=182136 RepID=A0ABS2ZH33_9BACL|nr:hypothetical protein [Fictibacillus barbaricus]MBN3546692.1 hypothetical protein [Fictibacillus barbaricus]GGB43066.1 hypothetical protein GCM10007199_05460 [Fictibacillus barbaricus]
MKELLARKLMVSILTTLTFTVGLFFIPIIRGMEFFFLWLVPIVIIFAGVIILVFGSLTSIILEMLLKKMVKKRKFYLVFYILCHGLFGFIGGLFLALADQNNWSLVPGGICGFMYAIIESYIFTKLTYKSKENKVL